jgi:ABC-type nitrate/sulfonate/bicarbonate transport system substrate-binding protein
MAIDTLWYTRCPAPTAATIAIREGWLDTEFAADGIAVRSLASSNDRQVHLSHYRHSQPNSFRFGCYVPPLISQSRGADIKVIGIAWHDRVHGIYALPDSGIETAADLKGKRLGVPVRLNDDVDWWRASVLGGYKALFASGRCRPQ